VTAAGSPHRARTRHFLTWWAVIVLMLATLGMTFAFGAIVLGYVAWIALDPAQGFGAAWHPYVAAVAALLVVGGSLWLLGYGLWILRGVVRASRALARERLEHRLEDGPAG
jgi:hypothetical protein